MPSEKYQKQLEVEKRNKAIIEKIITENSRDDFINFYRVHTQTETLKYFNIPNLKILRRILEKFSYDFSIPKPSKFKGKKAARSHESYIKGGEKSAKTQKEHWQNKSEEEKQAWSNKMKVVHSTEDFKEKIKQINIDYQANLSIEDKEKLNNQRSLTAKNTWKINKNVILEQSYKTKKKNKSFNTSSDELIFYNKLKEKFSEADIFKQYKSNVYPFACDFYIKSKDLYIELNINWTHGGCLFDINSKENQDKLVRWKEKAETSKFYQKAIDVWTIKDLQKFKIAKENNLNYKAFYTLEEAEKWLNTL